ncbi:regulatory protein RecX [Demequina mangrovi]|uniref:Regulatory protein RecX n=1 Tax=Demequina mangrovi TaxID=1043493 RepID=A0A1H6Z6K8_9MICO|nr:regulatory protein RecX [Demequina mangrovi]SEJ47634.1 regulatory protein [Demequina mangrovi]
MSETSDRPRGRRYRRPRGESPEDLEPITDPEKAREIALGVLTRASRSAAQLREKLISRRVEPGLADEIVARYIEVGLVDDAGLAATIVRTRHSERGQSRRAIRMELARKGFEPDHIDGALDQIDDEDERERAGELARRRWQQLAAHPVDVRTRRVVAMLGRKGYPSSLAFALVSDLRRADDEDGGC